MAAASAAATPVMGTDADADIVAFYAANPDACKVKDADGRLPLHRACMVKKPSEPVVVQLLKSHIGAAEVADKDGNLPLHLVVALPPVRKWKITPRVKQPLLAQAVGAAVSGAGISIGGPSVKGKRVAPTGVIKRLLTAFPKGTDIRNNDQLDPVHLAISKGAPSTVIHLLLETNLDPAARPDEDGRLLLHYALEHKCPLSVATRIAKAYPDANEQADNDGLLPVHIALAVEAPPTLVGMLLETTPALAKTPNDEGQLLLHFAAAHGCPKPLLNTVLRANGSAVREADDGGSLPLHMACASERCSEESVSCLLDAYPDAARVENDDGETPLHLATSPRVAARLMDLLYGTDKAGGAGSSARRGTLAAVTDIEPTGAREQLITLLSQHVHHPAWKSVASGVLADTVSDAETGLRLPRTDRHAVASALFALHGYPKGDDDGDDGDRKGADEADDEARPMKFSELIFLCGAPPDPSHWPAALVQAWCHARGWRCKPTGFTDADVGGPQITAWIKQDDIDGFDLGDASGILMDGLSSVGGIESEADRRAAVEELAELLRQRRAFEDRAHLEPLFSACASGDLRSVTYQLRLLREAARQAEAEDRAKDMSATGRVSSGGGSSTDGGDGSKRSAAVSVSGDATADRDGESASGAGGDAPIELDLDFTDMAGNTPLLVAINSAPAYRKAAAGMGDGSAGGGDGEDPGAAGPSREHAAVALVLLNHGARADVAWRGGADSGRPAFMMAVSCALHGVSSLWLDVARAMLSRGARSSTTDPSGRTALHLAVGAGAAAVARFLLETGCLLEARDDTGRRAADLLPALDEDARGEVAGVLADFVQVRLQGVVTQHTIVPRSVCASTDDVREYFTSMMRLRGAHKVSVQGVAEATQPKRKPGSDATANIGGVNPMSVSRARGAPSAADGAADAGDGGGDDDDEPTGPLAHANDLAACVEEATSSVSGGRGGEVSVRLSVSEDADFRHLAGEAFVDRADERRLARQAHEEAPLVAWEALADGESVSDASSEAGGSDGAASDDDFGDSGASDGKRDSAHLTPTRRSLMLDSSSLATSGAAAMSGAFVPSGAIPIGQAATVFDKLNALLWLIEEVNPLHVPPAGLLLHEGLDYNTDAAWARSTYRLIFLCQGTDAKLVPPLHEGYTIEAPGDALKTVIPAFQVAASLLVCQAMLEKYVYTEVPAGMPCVVDVPASEHKCPGLIKEGARFLLFDGVRGLRAKLAIRAANYKLQRAGLGTAHQRNRLDPLARMARRDSLLRGFDLREQPSPGMLTDDERATMEREQMDALDVAWGMINGHKDKFRKAYAALANLLVKNTTWREDHQGLTFARRKSDGMHLWLSAVQAQSLDYEILSFPSFKSDAINAARAGGGMAATPGGATAGAAGAGAGALPLESPGGFGAGARRRLSSSTSFSGRDSPVGYAASPVVARTMGVTTATLAGRAPVRSPMAPLSPAMYMPPTSRLSQRPGMLMNGHAAPVIGAADGGVADSVVVPMPVPTADPRAAAASAAAANAAAAAAAASASGGGSALPLYMTYSRGAEAFGTQNLSGTGGDAKVLANLQDMQRQHRLATAAMRDLAHGVKADAAAARAKSEAAFRAAQEAAAARDSDDGRDEGRGQCSIM